MRLPPISSLITTTVLLSKAVVHVVALAQESDGLPPPPEDGAGGPPVDAPTDDKELRGCRGMKFMLLDKLESPSEKLIGIEYENSLSKNKRYSNSSTTYHVKNEAGPRAATCTNGSAGGYPCHNVDLLSMLDLNELHTVQSPNELNDIWGWTDPSSGREFSIVGSASGAIFVEITDPYNPIILGVLPTKTVNSGWRDIKVLDHYALVISEASNHGMQIFDLHHLLTNATATTLWTEDAHYGQFGSAHNVFVNEDTGFAYAVGSNTCGGGLHVVDMNSPLSPNFAGCFSEDGYVHDTQCIVYTGPDSAYTGKEICFCSNEDTVTIVDVTDKANMQLISRKSYGSSSSTYTHQGWLTEDMSYFIFNDELDEYYGVADKTRTHVLDVRSLTSVTYLGFHEGRTFAIDHNLYVKGDLVYQAHYRAGLNVLKHLGSTNFEEVGYFDIFPSSDSNQFNGAWSTFPYYPSGVVTVSGIEQGLFILKHKVPPPTYSPAPTISLAPSKMLSEFPSWAPSPPVTECVGVDVTLNITTDSWPSENTWTIEDSTGTIVKSDEGRLVDPRTEYIEDFCLDSSECYTFTIYDSYGDGIFAPFSLIVDGIVELLNPTIDFRDVYVKFGPGCPCADREGKWLIDNKVKDWCSVWLYAGGEDNIAQRCKSKDLYHWCPVTCNSCPSGGCCDDIMVEIDTVKSQLDIVESTIQTILEMLQSTPTAAPVATCEDRAGQWALVDGGKIQNWCTWAADSDTPLVKCRKKDLYDDCPVTCQDCP